ncbi:PadR family transcriptional regulator [Kitasatospora sp. NPDC058397]|uniref:PadR family transcriptional regulator n=2 Tax=Kitasatosporales TaxID=85011 RepID=UPI0007AF5DFF
MSERVMQEPTLMVLTALADAPRHGYAIAQEVKVMTGGRVALRTGALYGALDRLLADGLIDIDREEIVDGRARRIFTLSPAGRERLAVEAERLAAAAKEATRRLSVAKPPAASA